MFKKIIGVNPLKYKKFINRSFDITDNEINLVLNNINKCNNLRVFTDNYLIRRKPTMKMEKVLKL